jgi:hypothetical protein
MDERITYHEDFYAWSQHQAAVLRDLATRRDLPNDLDLEHVAEEIEDVGTAELNSVRSFLHNMLVHLMKLSSSPSSEPVGHWTEEVTRFRIELLRRYSRSMRQKIELQDAWELARQEAEVGLRRYGEQLSGELPAECPFELEELATKNFDLEAALARLRPAHPS